MTPTTHLLTRTIFTAGAILSVWLGTQAFLQASAKHEEAENIRALYYNTAYQYQMEKARYEAIKASVELESKRTEVESSIKRVVMAEWKHCNRRGCK